MHSRAVLMNDAVVTTPGDDFTFRRSLRWDSSSGPAPAGSAPVSESLTIRRGFSTPHNFSVALPGPMLGSGTGNSNRSVFLILELLKDGVVLFTEDRIKIRVTD